MRLGVLCVVLCINCELVLPYLITGPLLYRTKGRVTLGKVSQVANAFGNVFAALNVLSDRWVDVTDWLSVLKRLKDWESCIAYSSNARSKLVSTEMHASDE